MKWIIPILIGLFNISLLIYPREVLSAAREGLLLWFLTVLPSLLPFMIAVNMLTRLGVFRRMSAGVAALVIGFISGYPMGAKVLGDMCREGNISPHRARRLFLFCNNAGPLFVVGAVGIGMFGNARLGYLLWGSHVLAALLIGVGVYTLQFLRNNRMNASQNKISKGAIASQNVATPLPREAAHIGKILSESVKNAMESMALVGGLIIFFQVVVRVLLVAISPESEWVTATLGGFFEVTGGVRGASLLGANRHTAALAAGIIGFGGLSVHAQALYFAAHTGARPVVYITSKLLHGLLAAGLMWLMFIFFPFG